MTNYIAPKLINRVLPITKGTDRVFSIRRRDVNGDPVDWNCSVFIDIDISKTNPTRVQATVTYDLATVRIDQTITDLCKTNTTWRAIMSEPGNPSVETALLVGIFERNDGK